MNIAIHNVTKWDITSKEFNGDDDCRAFEVRYLTVETSKGETVEVKMFLKREDSD